MSKYFHTLEFKACVPSCEMSDMDDLFLEQLDLLREACGFPLVLTCAFRSREWDIKCGRSGYSFHTCGRAADIRCLDSYERAVIIRNALRLGLSVGVYSRFIHIDNRTGDQVCFYGISYGEVSAPDLD